MTTIQRRADQLQPGDILPADAGWPRRTIYRIAPQPSFGGALGGLQAHVISLEWPTTPQPTLSPPLAPQSFNAHQSVNVEVPDLTPAQRRANEVLDLLERALVEDGPEPNWEHQARALLDELRPKPPTLDEVLSVLAESENHLIGPLYEILDRARRTGMLGGGTQ